MNPAPPKINSPNARFAGMVLAVAAVGIVATVFFFNPATHRFYPVCQFHRLTGLNCPGCGMTRAIFALLHGNLAAALHDNALLVVGLAGMGVRAAWFGVKKIGGRANGEFFPVNYLWPLLAVAVVFTVLRNLPAFAFLAP